MTDARAPAHPHTSPGSLYERFDVIPLALRTIPECTPHIERVFATLWRLSDRTTRRVDGHPLIDIAAEAGVAKGTVVKALNRLTEWGFVVTEGGGPGRGRVASYILLERRPGTSLKPSHPGKGHGTRTLDDEKVTAAAPQEEKRSPDGPHPSTKGSLADPHPSPAPYIENQRVITEQARRTRMLACPRCAQAHQQLYTQVSFDQHRKRWGRTVAATIYVHVVYLAAHSPGGVTNPSGLMRAIGRCYRSEDRPCSRPFCRHGDAAIAADLEQRHRYHTEDHPIRDTTDRWFNIPDATPPAVAASVVELATAMTITTEDDNDLEQRRQQLYAQLNALQHRDHTA